VGVLVVLAGRFEEQQQQQQQQQVAVAAQRKKERAQEALAEVAAKIGQLVTNLAAVGSNSPFGLGLVGGGGGGAANVGGAVGVVGIGGGIFAGGAGGGGGGNGGGGGGPTELTILYRDANASREAVSTSSTRRSGREGPILSRPLTVEGALHRFFERVAPADASSVPLILGLVGGSEHRLDVALDQLERKCVAVVVAIIVFSSLLLLLMMMMMMMMMMVVCSFS
jgi:hypothetical protein